MHRSVVFGATLLGAGALYMGGAVPAQADTTNPGYLSALAARGVSVSPQSAASLSFSGLAMCGEMRNNHSQPEDVARHWYYPNANSDMLVNMALVAQEELCPDTVS